MVLEFLFHACTLASYSYGIYYDQWRLRIPPGSRSAEIRESLGGNYKYLTSLNMVQWVECTYIVQYRYIFYSFSLIYNNI